MIDGLNQFFSDLSNLLWGWPMIILLLGTHIYLTIILRFPQRHIFKAIRLSIKRDHEATGDVSQFASLATALAATIGTGNIIGVATAICLRRSWCSVMVLADWCLRHLYKICRRFACH